MKKLLLLLLLAGAFPCPAQPAPKSPDEGTKEKAPETVTVLHDVVIGTGGGRPLLAEIAYPKNPTKQPMPAVLWIHGGGWSKGSHKKNNAQWLAEQGYFTASIEYRLSGEAVWPAQIEDCKLAVRWLRANAEKYHINPDRIGVWGYSAGGHLVACLGTMGDEARFEGRGGYEGVSSRVQAVVDYSGPVDFTAGSAGIQKNIAKPPDYESPGLLGLFASSFKDKPEVWKDGSPILYVKAGAPPFLIVHGDKDEVVPYEQSVKFEAALKKAGVPAELLTVRGGSHGMRARKGEPPAVPDSTALNAAVLAFLDKTLKN
ncbi:MAG TPA: alpha/beta hydrolase [Terrimicrobiaceae bacterium]|nr:alpha/beta hydrolase [Terrimicrobiaceae bacterium]